MNTLTKKTT